MKKSVATMLHQLAQQKACPDGSNQDAGAVDLLDLLQGNRPLKRRVGLHIHTDKTARLIGCIWISLAHNLDYPHNMALPTRVIKESAITQASSFLGAFEPESYAPHPKVQYLSQVAAAKTNNWALLLKASTSKHPSPTHVHYSSK